MDWSNSIFAQRFPQASDVFPDGTPIRLGNPQDYPDAKWYRNRYGAIIPVLPGEKPPYGAVLLPNNGAYPFAIPSQPTNPKPNIQLLPKPSVTNLPASTISNKPKPISISNQVITYFAYAIAVIVLIVAINRSKKR